MINKRSITLFLASINAFVQWLAVASIHLNIPILQQVLNVLNDAQADVENMATLTNG